MISAKSHVISDLKGRFLDFDHQFQGVTGAPNHC